MKILILLTSILLLGACATTPIMESVAGTYERKVDGDTYKLVFLENGAREYYFNDKKTNERKWSIVNGELHVDGNLHVYVWRINKDKSITWIAGVRGGKQTDTPKEKQLTYKKIRQPYQETNMKNIILLIAVMVVGACASISGKRIPVGTYELRTGNDIKRLVLKVVDDEGREDMNPQRLASGGGQLIFADGVIEEYINGKQTGESKWSLVELVHFGNVVVGRSRWEITKQGKVYRIINGDLTYVGNRIDGAIIGIPKDKRLTYKKIK